LRAWFVKREAPAPMEDEPLEASKRFQNFFEKP
jgi:hypothetical protein